MATEWHFPSVSAGFQWLSKLESSLIYQGVPVTYVRVLSLAELLHIEKADQTLKVNLQHTYGSSNHMSEERLAFTNCFSTR